MEANRSMRWQKLSVDLFYWKAFSSQEHTMIRPDDVRELLRKQPFQAFRIHMSNGQVFEVRHPDLAIVMRATIILGRPEPGTSDPLADGYDIISVLHINKLEVLAIPSTTVNTN